MVAQEVPTSTTMALPHGPTGVADARRRLRSDLYAQDVPEPVVDDAVLILSELLSNSCRHARPLSEAEDEGSQAERTGPEPAGAQAPVARFGYREGQGNGARAGRENGRTNGRETGRENGRENGRAEARAESRHPEARAESRHGLRVDAAGIRAAWSVGEDGMLVVEVTDGGGPTRPRPSSPSLTAHGGRGLGIVGTLAMRWGVRDAPGEVTVWAVLAVRGRHARRDESLGTGIGLPRGVPLDLPLDLAESLDDLG